MGMVLMCLEYEEDFLGGDIFIRWEMYKYY